MNTYGYDREFFLKMGINVVELSGDDSSKVLIVPAFQGRVMTSTVSGDKSQGFGWINYGLIQSGKNSRQFNPVGGEDRFWLGPEGAVFFIFQSRRRAGFQ